MLAGTAIALWEREAVWWKALLALAVSLLLQIGVNYANDYSDGIRGTDEDRVGPMRLVGSKAATPRAVKTAAFTAFGLAAAVVGLVLAATTAWWLVGVGLLSILAAWFYTGGRKPYGYLGLGEVMVFVFFGLVAVLGTTYVQTETLRAPRPVRRRRGRRLRLRDPGRQQPARHPHRRASSGKRTLAVVLGEDRTRHLYGLLIDLALVALVGRRADRRPSRRCSRWWPRSRPPARADPGPRQPAAGPDLVPVLQLTGVAELLYAAGIFAGIAVSVAIASACWCGPPTRVPH